MRTLYLIPDTNLFIQCRLLQELDWSIWAEFDEIHLIVCHPVQREIDNQKTRGKDRIRKRARKTNSLFRKIITSENGSELVQKAKPQVKLMVDASYLPSPELANQLDYNEKDDQIVGCLHTYKLRNSEADVRLLTHDTGPMASAKMCSLPFVVIPDDWLLEPESNDAERELIKLKTELKQLKHTEPHFVIRCLNDIEEEINSFEFESVCYGRLTDTEVSALIESLTLQFPQATDFGEQEPTRRKASNLANFILGIEEVFTPASEQEITEYIEKEYPEWVDKCKQILERLHLSLEKQSSPIIFSFSAVNEGSRPGQSALVTITAKGNFLIRPPQSDETDDENNEQDELKKMLSLPRPPYPPKGKWTTHSIHPNLEALGRISNQFQNLNYFDPIKPFEIPRLHTNFNNRRDPNAFYYKPARTIVPGKSFSLECEQWRHGDNTEFFEGEICFHRNSQGLTGAIECLIQAENLSSPFKKTIKVRGSIRHESARKHADDMIKILIGHANINS